MRPCSTTFIDHYTFTDQDVLLFDTNIWFFIYGQQKPNESKESKVSIYSNALKHILAANSQIYIDTLIISEFINTYSRRQFQIIQETAKKPYNDFKSFRKSNQFKSISKDISETVKQILKNCRLTKIEFEIDDMLRLLTEYAIGHSDFNDQIIVDICRKNKLKLVTDDGDFKNADISIVTANPSLLTRAY